MAATNGITVLANHVTLDLNGFALIGVAGALAGIAAPASTFDLEVRNGTIRNWPTNGINTLASDATFDGLNVYSNSGSFAMSPQITTASRKAAVPQLPARGPGTTPSRNNAP